MKRLDWILVIIDLAVMVFSLIADACHASWAITMLTIAAIYNLVILVYFNIRNSRRK